MTSFGHSRVLSDHASLFVKGLAQKGSPPWRDDDKDGHYMFELGENLTLRCNFVFSPFKTSFVVSIFISCISDSTCLSLALGSLPFYLRWH